LFALSHQFFLVDEHSQQEILAEHFCWFVPLAALCDMFLIQASLQVNTSLVSLKLTVLGFFLVLSSL